MSNQPTCDNNAHVELPIDKPRKTYQSPKLILLEPNEIESGTAHLQELDGGGFVGS